MRNSSKAFTLLEVIIAVFIITIGVIGVFTLIFRTILSGVVIDNKLVASYLAQEGIEIVHNIRDTNFLKIHGGDSIPWDEGIINPDGVGGNECATGCEVDYNDIALTGVSGSFHPLLRDGTTNIYSYDTGDATIFTREITATTDTNKIYVVAKVAWEERGQPREVVVLSELFNWLPP